MDWIVYQQLGFHMWSTNVKAPFAENGHYCGEETLIDDVSWQNRIAAAAKAGCTMMSVDLAEGLSYKSHPELAVKGSRSAEWMNRRVRQMRGCGITPIPALNFSTAHGYWLGKYSRMVSSPDYYRVCGDLIREVCDVFENPPYFHMGMDEENSDITKADLLSVRRQGSLLWHDIAFFQKVSESCGARAWMASDYVWWEPEQFVRNVSKEILQTNWYYGGDFDYGKWPEKKRFYVESFLKLDKAGFDQCPGCSNWVGPQPCDWVNKRVELGGQQINTDNIPGMVEFCRGALDARRLKGFVCLPWVSTARATDPIWINACEQFAAARKRYYP